MDSDEIRSEIGDVAMTAMDTVTPEVLEALTLVGEMAENAAVKIRMSNPDLADSLIISMIIGTILSAVLD